MRPDPHLEPVHGHGEPPGADIVREIEIDAPPDLVFSYFTDPARHVLWQGTDAEMDVRPGGRLRVTFATGYVASGEYVEVVRPRRLVYTWGWEEGASSILPAGASTVEITLEPREGGTLLRLRHRGMSDPGMLELHDFGWDECLSELSRRLRGGSEREEVREV